MPFGAKKPNRDKLDRFGRVAREMLQAPPGTRLFDRLQRESRVVNTFSGDNVDGTTNIIPRMGLDRLLDGYQSIMKQIYSPRNYYRRV
ncbi:MAG: DUF4070 domain-containing protein [Desulfobacteraceae bacterium]|jgi:hypothetical protein|nr:DUF4070 domain-containing protein [Desulfobacteraceae bacterium]